MNTCRRFSSMLRKSDKVRMNSFWLYPFWLYLTFNTVVALVKIIKSRKVARLFKYLASPKLLQSVYEGEIWCLSTVTFWEKVDFCNSRQVYCSRLYGIAIFLDNSNLRYKTYWAVHKRRRNFWAIFYTPLPDVGISTNWFA